MAFTNKIPSYEALLEFQEVYMRAIALAWRDEEFKKMLLADPLFAMQRYLHYRCPWNIDVKVTEAPAGSGWDSVSRSWNLPRNGMTFGVPNRPKVEEESIALAAYNDAGATYLFSCC